VTDPSTMEQYDLSRWVESASPGSLSGVIAGEHGRSWSRGGVGAENAGTEREG
jgi:hypothetical protein